MKRGLWGTRLTEDDAAVTVSREGWHVLVQGRGPGNTKGLESLPPPWLWHLLAGDAGARGRYPGSKTEELQRAFSELSGSLRFWCSSWPALPWDPWAVAALLNKANKISLGLTPSVSTSYGWVDFGMGAQAGAGGSRMTSEVKRRPRPSLDCFL